MKLYYYFVFFFLINIFFLPLKAQGIFDFGYNLDSDRKELENRIKYLANEKEKIAKNLEKTNKEKQQAEAQYQNYMQQTQGLVAKNKKLEEDKKQLQEEIIKLKSIIERLEEDKKQLQEEIIKLKSIIERLEEDKKNLQATIEEKDATITKLNDILDLYKSNLDNVRKEFVENSFELLSTNDNVGWNKVKLITKNNNFKHLTDRKDEIYSHQKAKKIKAFKIRARKGAMYLSNNTNIELKPYVINWTVEMKRNGESEPLLDKIQETNFNDPKGTLEINIPINTKLKSGLYEITLKGKTKEDANDDKKNQVFNFQLK